MNLKLRASKKKVGETGDKKSRLFWREPLIHFFVLGLSVFMLHTVLDRKPQAIDDDPYLVEVSSADIEWMRTLFNKQMGREPTGQDLRGQVNQLIREQVLSREAAAMGLDEGDIVVRRRLAQKMEFLFKDLSSMTEPGEDELRNYYTQHRQRYEIPSQVSLVQVFFNIDSRGIGGAKQAAEAITNANIDPDTETPLGDTSILSNRCTQCTAREIRDRFGSEFAKAVENLKPGAWYGPVKSAYGFHAVYIHGRQETEFHNFHDIIDQVKNDWMYTRLQENTRKVYEEIRARYKILVEGLPYDFDLKG